MIEFYDSPIFGLEWKGRYVRIGVGTTSRKDNAGRVILLPKGAIGYVASATAGSILVVFGADLSVPPPPTDHIYTVSHGRYKFACTFGPDDWYRLNIWLSK